jgi:hypothetical protein
MLLEARPMQLWVTWSSFDAPRVTFSKTETVAATDPMPAYCLVQGTINKRIGAGGSSSLGAQKHINPTTVIN